MTPILSAEVMIVCARFSLGELVATRGALQQLPKEDTLWALARHAAEDWGDLEEEDRVENERSLGKRRRLFSAYHSAGGVKFWIITEADRSATTVLLPEEY